MLQAYNATTFKKVIETRDFFGITNCMELEIPNFYFNFYNTVCHSASI
jgi:hypothetical protein